MEVGIAVGFGDVLVGVGGLSVIVGGGENTLGEASGTLVADSAVGANVKVGDKVSDTAELIGSDGLFCVVEGDP
jgi:hypothetical protein